MRFLDWSATKGYPSMPPLTQHFPFPRGSATWEKMQKMRNWPSTKLTAVPSRSVATIAAGWYAYTCANGKKVQWALALTHVHIFLLQLYCKAKHFNEIKTETKPPPVVRNPMLCLLAEVCVLENSCSAKVPAYILNLHVLASVLVPE